MSKLGKCCCYCNHPTCGKYCIGRNLPCNVQLSISGNHPATLNYPITWDLIEDETECYMRGNGNLNYSDTANIGHTHLKRWEQSAKYWDKATRKAYYCCPVVGYSPVPTLWYEWTGGGAISYTVCQRADLRYSTLSVRYYADSRIIDGQTVCGVTMWACLQIKRRTPYDANTCYYTTGAVTKYVVPCIAEELGSGTATATCGWCATGINGPMTGYSISDPATIPYPSSPPCNAPTDTDWAFTGGGTSTTTTYCIIRKKFIPNLKSIGCGDLSVTLGPSDTTPFGDCCYEQPFPDPVYFDDPPTPGPDGICCVGVVCPLDCTVTTPQYGKWDDGTAFSYGLDPFGMPYCSTEYTGDLTPLNSNPLAIGCVPGGYGFPMDETGRDRGFSKVLGIPDGTLLFGESLDTWTITLDCS